MSRPFKCRRIGYLPEVTIFKPAGIPMRELEGVSLSFEEAEAIRLKDLEGLEQEQAAEKMNISRPTFQRILVSARQKIADVILNGKAMRIEGGNFEVSIRRFKCIKGHEWEVPIKELENNPPVKCLICNTHEISMVPPPNSLINKKGKCCRRGLGCQKHNYQQEETSIIQQTDEVGKTQQPGIAD
jgi:uncharacterized protein